ncbi:hypothetical protein Nepgr_024957 [Nepenthes gracilis]|uniref:Uncharacterized protein n=1 Tax=Nepenthes gracilis TaxID=150966 RepID=A0AAD3Y0J3_NEPGR|nr:hypothetical protein Nepgr_024957 [Nepenthes gracilis]
MALNGVPLAPGTVYMCPRASKPSSYNPTLLPLSVRSSKSLNQGLKCSSSKGISSLHLFAASDLLLRGERVRFLRAFPGNPERTKCDICVMASKDVPYLSPYPP